MNRARARQPINRPRYVPVLLVLLAVVFIRHGRTDIAVAAADVVSLPAGCTAAALTWPAGTPLATVAAAVAPAGRLTGIWRYDTAKGRFVGYAARSGARIDYTVIGASGETATLCMSAAGRLTRPGLPDPGTPRETAGAVAAGATLPSGEQCASRVYRSGWEPRPENAAANQRRGTRIAALSGVSAAGNARLAPRVDGNFTGATDEIIQWAACKWGIDADIVRAMAMQESSWRQTAVSAKGAYGLMQIKRSAHPGTYPASESSTAFNLDYGLAWWRSCFEGFIPWVPGAARGDLWGCVGLYYSGEWKAAGGDAYAATVKRHLAEKPWLKPRF